LFLGGNLKSKATVLMAVCNGEKYLQEQIASIQKQQDVNVKIFYSDDCSTDYSDKILTKNPICRKLYETNGNRLGSAGSFLNLISLVKDIDELGDYIFLSDQDDIWLPNKMKEAILFLDNNFDCYSSSYFVAKNENMQRYKYVNKTFNNYKLTGTFKSPGPGFTYAFTKKSFLKIANSYYLSNYFPYSSVNVRWHDFLIFAVAIELGLNWKIDEKAHAVYRIHSNNDTGQLLSFGEFLKRTKYVLSGEFLKQVKLINKYRNDPISNLLKDQSMIGKFHLAYHILKIERKISHRILIIFSILSNKN
jgi:rhamnosyltransferase